MNKELLRQIGFKKEVDNFEAGLCSWCGKLIDVNNFRDTLSKKEYTISGFCQKCQDKTFGK